MPVLLDAEAPIPPWLRSRSPPGRDQIQEKGLIDAIYGRTGKVGPPSFPIFWERVGDRDGRILDTTWCLR